MPKAKDINQLADVQQGTEGFPKKEIKKVGIHNVQVPLNILRKDGTINTSSAQVSIYTNLNEKVRGANMSRYRLVVEEHLIGKPLNLREYLRELLKATKIKLGATDSYIKIKFDYFMIKSAPVSKTKSYINYKCFVEGKHNDNIDDFYLTVSVPYTSLCPCSKEISDYGAHNQRSFAEVKVKLIKDKMVWIEDIISLVEKTGSSPIINGLKRSDEAYQTELMYEHPMFVEDMARHVAEQMDKKHLDKEISDYSIIITHQESIHLHDAVAIITAGRELQ